jgi:hypothetical protein
LDDAAFAAQCWTERSETKYEKDKNAKNAKNANEDKKK